MYCAYHETYCILMRQFLKIFKVEIETSADIPKEKKPVDKVQIR